MDDKFLLPIKVLLDDNYKEFIPFVPTNAVMQYGTGKTVEELFAERYTKKEVDKIIQDLGTLMRLCGIIDSRSELPSDPKPGDAYIIRNGDNATEVVWIGEKWEDLGPLIDLSPYDTIEDVNAKLAANSKADQAYAKQQADKALADAKTYTDGAIDTFKDELNEYIYPIPTERIEAIFTEVLTNE